MNVYIDTCVLPRSQLQTAGIYREMFGPALGFELLMMFDLAGFEENLRQNLDLFSGGPLLFHEPVWGVEHSAPKGSPAWEEGMYHLRLTKKYAEILHPSAMVYHLNNCAVEPSRKDRMLRTALENLDAMREMFPGIPLLVENTGTRADGTMLLDQAEFTDLCRGQKFPVLIDVGHANANGWDIRKLVRALRDQIGGFHLHNNDGIHDLHNRITDGTLDFAELVPYLDETVPDAPRIIEYSRPAFHGDPLAEDIRTLSRLAGEGKAKKRETQEADPVPGDLSAEKIQFIMGSIDDAVLLTGADGSLLYTNPSAVKLFGVRADGKAKIWEAVGFKPENDELVQLFIDALSENKPLHSLVDYVNKDGKQFRLRVNLTRDLNGDREILIVISDLTYQIRAQSAFARYTSPEIAEYVMTNPEGENQGGENRDVSILMSDLRGFTAMSFHLASSDMIGMLNHYFECMSAVIRRFGGTIIEFLGDGIFVVFGAPYTMQDHASAAVSCAVEMQNAMAEVNAWNREKGYPELEMGIGISTGTCTVGNIGSANRMKYGCMGDTVNLAGRLESFTLGGEIHILEETRKRIPENVEILREGSFVPKGSQDALKFFNIAGIGKNRIRRREGNSAAPESLPEPCPVVFRLLKEKIVDPTDFTGCLTAVSADGKTAILATETVIGPLQNLAVRFGGEDLYAKAEGREENGYRIVFTFGKIPPEKLKG